MAYSVNSVQNEEMTSGSRAADASSAIGLYTGAVVSMSKVSSKTCRTSLERRQSESGRLGRRATDVWMPYSTAFLAQLIGQNDRKHV